MDIFVGFSVAKLVRSSKEESALLEFRGKVICPDFSNIEFKFVQMISFFNSSNFARLTGAHSSPAYKLKIESKKPTKKIGTDH